MEHVSEDCTCTGKECTKCEKLLCVGNYTKDKRLKSRLKSECRICARAKNKEWRESNHEYDSERHKRYRQENLEKVTNREKEYKHKNRARIREREREYWTRHRNRHRANVRRSYISRRHKILERNKIYRRMNIEQIRLKERQRYWSDRNRRLAQDKQWRSSPAYEEWWKQYYAQKGHERRARYREYSRTHRDYIRDRDARYLQANLRKHAAAQAKRRTQKTRAGGSYTVAEWEALKCKYNYTCLCCGKREPDINLTADHIIPVNLNGSSYIDNIQPLCGSCNSSKGRKLIDFRPQNT